MSGALWSPVVRATPNRFGEGSDRRVECEGSTRLSLLFVAVS